MSLARGASALALPVGLEFIIGWSRVRARWVRQPITGEPSLPLYRGEFLQDALRRTWVAEDEVRAAVRSTGLAGLDAAGAMVLETRGSFSVVRGGGESASPSLSGIETPHRSNRRAAQCGATPELRPIRQRPALGLGAPAAGRLGPSAARNTVLHMALVTLRA